MTPIQFPLNVRVRGSSAGYTAQTVGTHRASSTSSDQAAMGRLVDRLTAAQQLPIGSLRAVELSCESLTCGVSVWRIEHAG